MTELTDDIIFECQDAAAEERMRWTFYELGNCWQAVRNRLSTKDHQHGLLKGGHVIELEAAPETMRFTSLDYAKSYVDWRGHKAALERYQELLQQNSGEPAASQPPAGNNEDIITG